jgi:hypothetical protein
MWRQARIRRLSADISAFLENHFELLAIERQANSHAEEVGLIMGCFETLLCGAWRRASGVIHPLIQTGKLVRS